MLIFVDSRIWFSGTVALSTLWPLVCQLTSRKGSPRSHLLQLLAGNDTADPSCALTFPLFPFLTSRF